MMVRPVARPDLPIKFGDSDSDSNLKPLSKKSQVKMVSDMADEFSDLIIPMLINTLLPPETEESEGQVKRTGILQLDSA